MQLRAERALYKLLFDAAILRADVPKEFARVDRLYGGLLAGYEALECLRMIAAGTATDKDAHALYSRLMKEGKV
jgi:hypothetical protein